MAFYELHRYVRRVVVQELQLLVNDHPMYTTDRADDTKFQTSPTKVMERYNFDGRQYPAIVVTTTESNEQRLSMDRLITEAYGHSRAATMMSYVTPKVVDDSEYTGTYSDAVYLLEYAQTFAEDDEDIKLKKFSVAAVDDDPTGASGDVEWFDIVPDERRTDIIDGVEIHIGSFNDIRPGNQIYIETFEDNRYLGDIFGSRFDISMNISVYAQTQYETEELLDMVNSWFTYYLPHQLYFKHSINAKTVNTSGAVEKDERYGEEAFTGNLTVTFSVEHQFFNPVNIMTSYQLWLALREQVDSTTGQILLPIEIED